MKDRLDVITAYKGIAIMMAQSQKRDSGLLQLVIG